MLERLNRDLVREQEDVQQAAESAANLEAVLEQLQAELKATKRQHIRVNRRPRRVWKYWAISWPKKPWSKTILAQIGRRSDMFTLKALSYN